MRPSGFSRWSRSLQSPTLASLTLQDIRTTAALTRLKPVWNDNISLSSKIRLMRSLVTSIFLYACESWTITVELQRRIRAMEIKCYRKLLRISYKDHVTNEEVCAKIQQAIGPREDLTRRRRKETQTAVVRPCPLFIRSGQNHLARHSNREKETMQVQREVKRQHQGMDRIHRIKVRSSPRHRGQWGTENWLQNHLWCPNDPRG